MVVEFLISKTNPLVAERMQEALKAAIRAAGDTLHITSEYEGHADVLLLYGVGAPVNNAARNLHLKSGGRVVVFDMGYFSREKAAGFLRFSIDHDHPQRLLDATDPCPSRWESLGIDLREDASADGHVVLVGMGQKSARYLGLPDWDAQMYRQLERRFGRDRILYRPKRRLTVRLPCRTDLKSPIEQVLIGASLIVSRHSNVAVDGIVAGVQSENEDGAAMWMVGKPFDSPTRLDFLRRLAWWQYRPEEADKAWAFISKRL